MTATPATMVRQITTARVLNRVQGSTLAYRTESGVTSYVPRATPYVPVVDAYDEQDDDHCFVCSRHTSHYAEHDDMVEAGTAYYDGGDVWPTGSGPRVWDTE